MLFDINGLKTENDTIGHEAGDELICGSAECMKNAFSRHGKIYRVGGD
ncbi:MAG: diguanylate cyclase [Gammaproteobacteria bacterium]|nr:diguanylate cyclase [Gammaproteobacteria bacterium]